MGLETSPESIKSFRMTCKHCQFWFLLYTGRRERWILTKANEYHAQNNRHTEESINGMEREIGEGQANLMIIDDDDG